MYDTSQKDRLYFEVQEEPRKLSFALISDEEMVYEIPVKLMGCPADYDRNFTISYLDVDKDTYVGEGDKKTPVVKGKENVDFKLENLTIPAGQVESKLKLTLYRTEELKSKYVSVKFKIAETEEFLPMDQDSTDMDYIISEQYELYVNDGEPVNPEWWAYSAGNLGWQMYIGKFYPEKYRVYLKLFHEIEDKNQALYEELVKQYGENLDNDGIRAAYFAYENPSMWANYVLIPLYNHFKAFYEENPDHPDAETFEDRGSLGQYWSNPMKLLR